MDWIVYLFHDHEQGRKIASRLSWIVKESSTHLPGDQAKRWTP